MIKDLYIRSSEDPNYQFLLEHSDVVESIITKIKTILGTRQGSVIGDLNFGVGVEDLIFETRINKMELEERIKTQITQYISETKDYDIKPVVSFGKADGYEYACIDILIENQKIIGILIK